MAGNHRRQQRAPTSSVGRHASILWTEAADEEALDIEEETCRSLRTQIVREALPFVRQDYRNYIYLRDFEGWSYEQIGHFYGVSVASVRSTLLRARRVLKEELKRVAEEKGQWPLPALIPNVWVRIRSTIEGWTDRARATMAEVAARLGSTLGGLQATVANIVVANAALATMLIALTNGPGHASGVEPVVPSSPAVMAIPFRESSTDVESDVLAVPMPSANATETSTDTTSGASQSQASEADDAPTQGAASDTESSGASQSTVTIEVTPPQSQDVEGGTTYESPSASASADVDGDDEADAGSDPGPVTVGCPPPEERSTVAGLVCGVLDETPALPGL